MNIPNYPDFAPVNLNMRTDLHPRLSMLKDGISELTFAGIYLFRNTYSYRVSWLPNETLVIFGEKDGERFFMLPCGIPGPELLQDLFARRDYLKNLSETDTAASRILLEQNGYTVEEDRNNFDYIYLRKDLATLPGKNYHKKRNLVNAFLNNYEFEQRPMRKGSVKDAIHVLDAWREAKGEAGDYAASREALELMELLNLKGHLYYVDGRPAAYTLGRPWPGGGASPFISRRPSIHTRASISSSINPSPPPCPNITPISTGSRTWGTRGSDRPR